MSINFETLLTKEQKAKLLENRISQVVSEAYSLSMNLKIVEKLEDTDQVEAITKSLTILDTAFETLSEELKFLISE